MTADVVLCLVPLGRYHASGDIRSPQGLLLAPDLPAALEVANAHYRDTEEPVVAVELDIGSLSAPVQWGRMGGTMFARLHEAVDRAAIGGVHYARRDVAGRYLGLHRRSATAEEFDLLPHPEGGWFRRTWTSSTELTTASGTRPTATAILFLLTAGETSQWHTVASDELWLWHRGASLSLQLAGDRERPATSISRVTLGSPTPQALVPAGTWQRAVASPTAETLTSCVVSPGFDFADFRTLTK